jgi:hypothetical protein
MHCSLIACYHLLRIEGIGKLLYNLCKNLKESEGFSTKSVPNIVRFQVDAIDRASPVRTACRKSRKRIGVQDIANVWTQV